MPKRDVDGGDVVLQKDLIGQKRYAEQRHKHQRGHDDNARKQMRGFLFKISDFSRRRRPHNPATLTHPSHREPARPDPVHAFAQNLVPWPGNPQ